MDFFQQLLISLPVFIFPSHPHTFYSKHSSQTNLVKMLSQILFPQTLQRVSLKIKPQVLTMTQRQYMVSPPSTSLTSSTRTLTFTHSTQPCWPPRCFLYTLSILPSQGLYVRSSTAWKALLPLPEVYMAHSLTSFRLLFKCLLFRKHSLI